VTAAGSWQEELLAAAAMAPRERPRARSALNRLADFAAGRGLPPSPECLLDYDVIEAFCVAGLAGRASSTRGTYRSVLYQLAAPVHGQPGCRGTPFAGARSPAPYSPAERAALAAAARAQRGPASRASALAMVVFGIGAGLRPGELARLRGSHVTRRGDGGKAPGIEAALASPAGRRRPLPVRAVLTALLCLALDDRPLFLTDATRLLFCQLSGTSRALLGVTGTAAGRRGFLAAYRRLRYCFHAILPVMDPSALPKNRRLSEHDLQARARKMTPAQARAARDRLEDFLNSLLEASISVLDDDERAASDGSAGLDATPVPLFSRGPSRRAGLCASDPDGGWYVREGDHRERQDNKGKPLRKIYWALEASIVTMARLPGAIPGCPNLAAALALARPGEDPGGTGARLLASVAARGHKAGYLGFDRAYTAALPERFHLPARALGYSPVMDYRAGQLGIQAHTGGAILVEGSWYCPALPEPLITATTDLRAKTNHP